MGRYQIKGGRVRMLEPKTAEGKSPNMGEHFKYVPKSSGGKTYNMKPKGSAYMKEPAKKKSRPKRKIAKTLRSK